MRHKCTLQDSQQVVFVERICGIQHLIGLLFRQFQTHGCQLVHHSLTLTNLLHQLDGQGVHQMPLRNATVFSSHGQRQYVLVIVQGNTGQKCIDFLDHLAIALMTGSLIGAEEFGQHIDLIVRHALDGHVADANLVRIVGATALQTSAIHGNTSFHANGNRHLNQLCSFQELLSTGNGIMVNDTGGAQTLHTGGIYRRCGGIR